MKNTSYLKIDYQKIFLRISLLVGMMIVINVLLSGHSRSVFAETSDAEDGGVITWSVVYDLEADSGDEEDVGIMESSAEVLESDLKALIQNDAYDLSVDPGTNEAGTPSYEVNIAGNGIESLTQALYTDLNTIINPLGGSILIQLTGSVKKDEAFTVELEANTSTGYLWEIMQIDSSILEMNGEISIETRTSNVGSSQKQIIPFRAIADGDTSLSLVYRRSFESDETINRRILLNGDHLHDLSDLSDPNAVIESSDPPEIPEGTNISLSDDLVEALALPSSFDWRDQGLVTDIRNQHSCGSCWAFATVATMEVAMLVQGNGPEVDLSEQFLVSCNQNGWSCNGGWRAHPYHSSTLGKNQTEAGAVLEADFPYINANGTCSKVYDHPYQIASWGYVDGYTIPAEADIKAAIYKYGAVTASVCTGPAFSAYRGGIFNTDESSTCGSYKTNHAVTLVGWNDAEDTWIMKNSWGTWWGEGGYMRIDRDVSNIGYAATYVVYTDMLPKAPAPVSPNETVNTITPTFIWNSVDGITEYQISVDGLVSAWYQSSKVCSGTTCQITPTTELSYAMHEWKVKGRNTADVESRWSSVMAFEVSKVPKMLSPTGDVYTSNPTFKWNQVDGAINYKLQVNNPSGTRVFLKWLTSAETCIAGDGTCQYTPTLNLPYGSSTWYIKSRDASLVESLWSNSEDFTVKIAAPTPISPKGISDSFAPTYTWSSVDGATNYIFRLIVYTTISSTRLITQDMTSKEANCASGEEICTYTPQLMLNGSTYKYYWRVNAYNENSVSELSSKTFFSTPPAPGVPTILSPVDQSASWTPSYQWQVPTGGEVTSYVFYLVNEVNGIYTTLHKTTYNASDICDLETCSITPNVVLGGYKYQWWVRAKNPSGKSNWSSPGIFTAPNKPSLANLLSPNGVADSWSPTYTWGYIASECVTDYQFYIYSNNSGSPVLIYKSTYKSSTICSGETCSVTPKLKLGKGTYSWRVKATNLSGMQKSKTVTFTTPSAPEKPTITSPNGTVDTFPTTFTWVNSIDDVVYKYDIYVATKDANGKTVVVLYLKYLDPTLICSGDMCSITPEITQATGTGLYTWWVKARNPSGMTRSNIITFTVSQ